MRKILSFFLSSLLIFSILSVVNAEVKSEVKVAKVSSSVEKLPYVDMGAFKEGLAWFMERENYENYHVGFLDVTGKVVIKAQFDAAQNFSEGIAAVQKNGKWGFIDKTGKVIISFQYDEAYFFSDGLARVTKDNLPMYIDKTGKVILSLPNVEVAGYQFSEGLVTAKKNGKWGFIDKTGKEVIPFQYDDLGNFSEGLAAAKKNGKWGFINKNGEVIINYQYDKDFYEFFDLEFADLYYARYDEIPSMYHFKEGLAPVRKNRLWGFIDKQGNEVIKPKYGEVHSGFSEGLAYIEYYNNEYPAKMGYIDKTGKEVSEFVYDQIGTAFNNGYAISIGSQGINILKNPLNPATLYQDFKAGEYWSEDILWAIENGLIKGYVNTKHPTTGQVGTWLNPFGDLTEVQLLSVIFQYSKQDEFRNTSPSDPNYWASVQYQMAAKYHIPTKASLTNRAPATQPTTRGIFAQALASIHFGRSVNEQEAVQFMYEAGISDGYADANGKFPKTFESFRTNNILKRAQLVTFMKRYDDYINN